MVGKPNVIHLFSQVGIDKVFHNAQGLTRAKSFNSFILITAKALAT